MIRPKPIKPEQGQESVWDYPRPPKLESCTKHIHIVFNGVTIADTRRSQRVLETSHPPVYYIPLEDINLQYVKNTPGQSFCEWKGNAIYYSVVVGDKELKNVGWGYPNPTVAFTSLKDTVAFYAQPMDGCYVDGEKVIPQPGNFYGGWITSDVVGPFKGEAGSWGW